MHELTPEEIEELIKLDETTSDEEWREYWSAKLNKKEFTVSEETF